MTDNDPKTFDLMAAIQGRTYPEKTVTIFFHDELMFTYAQASEAADRNPSNEELSAAVDTLLEETKEFAYKVTVRGVPRPVLKSIAKTVSDKHPIKKDNFGNEKPNPDADEMYTQLLWQQYIVAIKDPSGAEKSPSDEEIKALRDEAPDSSLIAIAHAIADLSEKTSSGYEQVVQGLDFLSQPSPKG